MSPLSNLGYRFKLIAFYLGLGLAGWGLLGGSCIDSCVAQNLLDRRELGKYERKVESFRNQYLRSARRDPANEGAKSLSVKLDSVRSLVVAFAEEKRPKQHVQAAIQEAAREASRYATPQAQKTVQLLAELANFLKTQPDLDYLRMPAKSATADQVAQHSETPHPSSPSPAPKSPSSLPAHPQLQSQPSDSQLNTLHRENPDLQEQPSSEESLTWDVILLWLLVTLLVVLLVLLYRKLGMLKTQLNEQHKSFQQQLLSLDFKQSGQAAATGSGDFLDVVRKDFNKRMDRIEQNTAEFIQLLETRLQHLEQGKGGSTGLVHSVSTEIPDFLLQNLEQRIIRLESQSAPAPHSRESVPSLTHLPEPAHLEAIYDALVQIRRQSNLKPLTDRAQWLTDQLKRAEHQQQPELLDLHLAAELIQLAHVAAYNEQLDDPSLALVRAFEPLGLIADPAQAGDGHLPADVAANIPFDRYRQEARFVNEELPNRPTVLRQIEKRWPGGKLPAGALAHVLQPSIWFHARNQPRILLAKGQYVVS